MRIGSVLDKLEQTPLAAAQNSALASIIESKTWFAAKMILYGASLTALFNEMGILPLRSRCIWM